MNCNKKQNGSGGQAEIGIFADMKQVRKCDQKNGGKRRDETTEIQKSKGSNGVSQQRNRCQEQSIKSQGHRRKNRPVSCLGVAFILCGDGGRNERIFCAGRRGEGYV